MTTVALAGASGYAGGEILRLLLGHPAYADGRLTIGALTAAASAGTTLGEHHPHLLPLAAASSRAHRHRRAARPRRGVPGPAARPFRRAGRTTRPRHPGHRLRRGLPAHRRRRVGTLLRVRRTPAAGPTGCRNCPAAARRCAAPSASRYPAAIPTAALLALLPAVAADLVEPAVTVVAVSGTSGAGRAAKVDLLGSEVIGSARAYSIAGVAPAHPRDRAGPARGHRPRRHGVVHAGAHPDLARHPGHLHRTHPGTGVASCGLPTKRLMTTSLSCICCPKGSCPAPVR